jgi:TPR repeat protein
MSSRPLIPCRFLLRVVLAYVIAGACLAAIAAHAQNIDNLLKQAKAGDSEAQYQLANVYLSGTGGASKDLKQGVEWLRKAASLDHAAAQFALWVMYRSGFPPEIPKDPAQGLPWLRKSADHGYSTAQYNLGLLYRDGDGETGVPRKPHEAAIWFRKAARQPGSTKSQAGLAEMLQQGLITKQEANWQAPEPSSAPPKPTKSGAAPFSLAEVETGLKGNITSKRLATLVQQFGVDFKLSDASQKRLVDAGAAPDLLLVISTSKRSL